MDNTDTDKGPEKSLLETLRDLREWALRTGEWEAAVWRDFDRHLNRLERTCDRAIDEDRCVESHVKAELRGVADEWADYLRNKMRGVGKATSTQDALRNAARPWGLGAGSKFAGSREPSVGTREPRFRKAVRDSLLDTGFMLAIGAVTALGGYLVGTFDGADAATLWKTVPAIGIAAMGCVFAGFLRGAYRYAGRKN